MDNYSSARAVPSTISASGKDVRDIQSKIRTFLVTLVSEGALKSEDKAILDSLHDNLSTAIDDQLVLIIERMDRIRKSEQQAVNYAKNMRRKMQKVVDFCEQQTGAKVDASLYDEDDGYRLPPPRRRKQVTVLGMELDRIDVDEASGAPARTHYPSHGKYSSSEDEEENADGRSEDSSDCDDDESPIRLFGRSSSLKGNSKKSRSNKQRKAGEGGGRSRRSSSISSATSDASPIRKRRSSSLNKAPLAATQPLVALNERLFSVTKSVTGGSNTVTPSSHSTRPSLLNGNNSGLTRKNAGDVVLDNLSLLHKSGRNPNLSLNSLSGAGAGGGTMLQYTSKVSTTGPDRLTLEALSCFLYSLLQSTSHLVQAERARLYIPHKENQIMKVVCAVPDASIVHFRGGQYIAAHQGLPGAAMATGVAISVDRVTEDIRRNYLSTTLHGGGSLAADEHRNSPSTAGAAQNASGGAKSDDASSRGKRSGTVESIFVFPIRHNAYPNKIVGVFEFINKIHLLPWSEHDEQLCFNASRLASYWLSTYEGLLDLHHLPAFQPQESYFTSCPYRPAGMSQALAANKLGAVANHTVPLYIARVTQMEDVPTKQKRQGLSSSPSSNPLGELRDGEQTMGSAISKRFTSTTAEPTSPRDRIKEVGSIRYVRELTAYLRELERTGMSNVAEIVATRDSQSQQVDDLIKQKSRVKALEDNNNYLRDKLLETQKKLALYMNQMHGGVGATVGKVGLPAGLGLGQGGVNTSSKMKALIGNSSVKDANLTTSGGTLGSYRSNLGKELFGGGKANNPGGGEAFAGNESQQNAAFASPLSHKNRSASPVATNSHLLPSLRVSERATYSKTEIPTPTQEQQAPTAESLRDFLHEAKLSLASLKQQALLSAPPGTSASTFSALSFETGSIAGRRGKGGQVSSNVEVSKPSLARRSQSSMR